MHAPAHMHWSKHFARDALERLIEMLFVAPCCTVRITPHDAALDCALRRQRAIGLKGSESGRNEAHREEDQRPARTASRPGWMFAHTQWLRPAERVRNCRMCRICK